MNSENRILFEAPNLEELTKEHSVFDMHFHSRYTDGTDSVQDIIERAHQLNIGIAITDHNDIRAAVEIDQDQSVPSIPGIEITSEIGTHLLIYFYHIEYLKEFYVGHVMPYLGKDVMSPISLHLDEIIRRAKAYECIIIFPHPYSAVYTGVCNYNFSQEQLRDFFSLVDGVEVINSGNFNKWNLQCAILGFNLDKAITGGSDGHALHHMGKVVTWADCKKDRRSFLDAIKNKENKVIGKEMNLLKKVTSNSHKLKSNLKNSPDNIGRNIRYGYTFFNSKSKQFRENFRNRIATGARRGMLL